MVQLQLFVSFMEQLQMPEINQLNAFIAVAKAGGFAEAARVLKQPKSSLSRRIAALESELGVTLLHRTTRHVRMTNAGERYFQDSIRIIADLENATSSAIDESTRIAGAIKMTAPLAVGKRLAPIFASFCKLYPDVHLDLRWSDAVVDFLGEGYDLALRAGHQPDSTMKAIRIGTESFGLHATPGLAKQCSGLTLAQIHTLPVISYSIWGDTWKLSSGKSTQTLKLRPIIKTNDIETLIALTSAGAGIALLPKSLVTTHIEDKALVPVFETWGVVGKPIFIILRAQRFVPARLRVFVDYLKAYVKL